MNAIRIMLFVVAIGAALIAGYGLFIETSDAKLPLVVSGSAVLGLSLGLLGFMLAGLAIQTGEDDRALRALGIALLGGLCVMIAAGALAAAIVLGILTGTA
jgi:hypothetical protein